MFKFKPYTYTLIPVCMVTIEGSTWSSIIILILMKASNLVSLTQFCQFWYVKDLSRRGNLTESFFKMDSNSCPLKMTDRRAAISIEKSFTIMNVPVVVSIVNNNWVLLPLLRLSNEEEQVCRDGQDTRHNGFGLPAVSQTAKGWFWWSTEPITRSFDFKWKGWTWNLSEVFL